MLTFGATGYQNKGNINFLVVKTDDDTTILNVRKGKGIWQGLYQFPLIESDKNIDKNELISSMDFDNLFPEETTISLFNKNEIIYKLSHQHLHTKFWIIETKNSLKAEIKWNEIEKYPVPILIANFLDAFLTKK